jgi:hypothetical protein
MVGQGPLKAFLLVVMWGDARKMHEIAYNSRGSGMPLNDKETKPIT